jgi:dipeptidyl aminopeptidase/acylaminoacyl peptidase
VDSAGSALVALEGDSASGALVRIDLGTGAVTPVDGAGDFAPVGRPAIRGDGAIVYACRAGRSTDICRLDPGKAARRLTEDGARDRDPAWSPSGGSVVFSSDREGGSFELYAMRQDGSGVRRLTKQKGEDVQPAWVP